MIVLSLFDGISCGYEALKRIGIKVNKYYASEIDEHSIQIAQKNHPDIIQIGDISDWKKWEIEKPDLIIGGSPCQGFSVSGDGLNFEHPQSKLFFTMVDIVNFFKPKYRFLENVKMKKDWVDIISHHIGANPVLINSSLVSAQNRERYYWFDWSAEIPEDKGILLKNIIENGFVNRDKSYCIDANYHKGGSLIFYFIKCRRQLVFNRDIDFNKSKMELINELSRSDFRNLTPIECERLQTLPDNYTDGVANSHRYRMIGNGWTIDIIANIFKHIKKRKSI